MTLAPGVGTARRVTISHVDKQVVMDRRTIQRVLRRIAHEAPLFLKPGGLLAFELAPAQADEMTQCLSRCGFEGPKLHRDLGGRPRVITARSRGTGES